MQLKLLSLCSILALIANSCGRDVVSQEDTSAVSHEPLAIDTTDQRDDDDSTDEDDCSYWYKLATQIRPEIYQTSEYAALTALDAWSQLDNLDQRWEKERCRNRPFRPACVDLKDNMEALQTSIESSAECDAFLRTSQHTAWRRAFTTALKCLGTATFPTDPDDPAYRYCRALSFT